MADAADREPSGDNAGDESPQHELSLDRPAATSESSRPHLSPGQIEAIREAFVGGNPEAARFSLWGLLGIVSGASLILAVGSYFPKPVFAGALGIATFVSLGVLSAMKHPPGILQVAWWVLLLIYLMAILSAILG